MNPYIADILSQPSVLRTALEHFPPENLDAVRTRLEANEFDRIILTGMGSSYNACYPALIQLCKQPLPVQLVNASELLHSLSGTIGTRSLLWMNSQSGRSAELVHLLERIRSSPPACILSSVNDLSSPLAISADVCIPIHAGEEATVSTKTFVNMLAVNLLAAIQLTGGDVENAVCEMRTTADAMESYLAAWESHVRETDSLLGDFQQLYIIGRGSSMSAVWNGSLNNKEAAKCSFEGIHAADFRHGPLEVVEKGFVAIIFAGSAQTSGMNRALAQDILSYNGRVIWVDSKPDAEIPTLLLPAVSELSRPLVEILPMQLLTLLMAKRKRIEAGMFRYIHKVTVRE